MTALSDWSVSCDDTHGCRWAELCTQCGANVCGDHGTVERSACVHDSLCRLCAEDYPCRLCQVGA